MTDKEKFLSATGIFNYKGNICQKIFNGWIIHNQVCTTFEEVEDVLMNLSSILNESIYRVENNGNIACTNTQGFENGIS